jgi:hypothetical protein
MSYNSDPKLDRILLALTGDLDLVKKWWSGPNRAFDNRTPTEVYAENKTVVEDYIYNFFDR